MRGKLLILLMFSICCALMGVLLVYLSGEASGIQELADEVTATAEQAFSVGWWRRLPLLAGTAVAAAVVATSADVLARIGKERKTTTVRPLGSAGLLEKLSEVRQRIFDAADGRQPDVVRVFDELLSGAVACSASDIHLTPSPESFKLTYRVRGTLHTVAALDPTLAPRITSRLKVLAGLDIYVRGTPQDGRLAAETVQGRVDARLSTLPADHGERVVLRLVRGGRSVPDLETLGFNQEVEHGLLDLLARPEGLLLVTGPVGSGKTTSLYAALRHIASTRGRTTTLVTLEDPIEMELPFATQTQMKPRAGRTFASTLRSVLRQDPNVLMVGEIRDAESAGIAAQAGLTGHLILTTVHAQSSAGPFARLGEMGVEPFVLGSAIVGCLSQRLVRTLCMACRCPAVATDAQRARFSAQGVVIPEAQYFAPVGCELCENEGFAGRKPIAELLVVNESVRELVGERRTTSEIHHAAVAGGMTPLLRDGLARAQAGDTSLEEVLRVAG